jgi:7-cyano-7-deazaguanine synthase
VTTSKHDDGSTPCKSALILLSGGVDSSVCLTFLQGQGLEISALFVDYGQSAAKEERAASLAISGFYKVPIKVLEVSGFRRWVAGYIKGRNAFLLYTALMAAEFSTGLIALGIHAGTSYVDCSEYFVRQLQASFDIYTDGRVRIHAPFLNWNKREIWEYGRSIGAPFDRTYSCEMGGEPPCGQCTSCIDREALT